MNTLFSELSAQENQDLKDAFAKITVYIAGADGTIDAEEITWAEKVTEIRSYKMTDDLLDFYKEVHEEFEQKLDYYIAHFKGTSAERNAAVESHLSALNPILAKLDLKVGAHLYKGFVSFADHVAKATGGILGFFTIGPAEKALLGLKMITPIESEDTEEEE
jgi:hypothetical protein